MAIKKAVQDGSHLTWVGCSCQEDCEIVENINVSEILCDKHETKSDVAQFHASIIFKKTNTHKKNYSCYTISYMRINRT